MKVHFTEQAEQNLATIYAYHSQYSHLFAKDFNDQIIDFIVAMLTTHPKVGHIHNQAKDIYRLIFKQRYNIYYLIQDNTVFILFILDGRLRLNESIAKTEIDLPPLT